MKPTKLMFGPSGIPHGANPRKLISGIEYLKKIGLDCNELAFVHSVFLKEEPAKEVSSIIKKESIFLTAHGSYYINLNALEEEKIIASRERILKAARIGNLAGVWSLTFHPAYYLKNEPKIVYNNVKDELKKIVKILQNESNPIWIRPETTGKPSQFGVLKEILKLSTEIEQIMPCVDFSHIHARNNGGYNSYEEFSKILSSIEETLGREGLDNMHIHLSGIEYGEKGEKHHLNLKESDMKYKELAKAWKDFNIKGCVTIESPNQEDDALLMKKVYEKNN